MTVMTKRIALTEVAAGSTVAVAEILGGHGIHHRLRALGIRPGSAVKKISDSLAGGPIVVQCGASQTALGRGICEKILVETPA